MQQNTKGILLFAFLISVSVFGINLFNNNDSEESVEVTQTTLFEATTTTTPAVKVEKYVYPSFDFEKETSTSLESISDLCYITGNWFSLTRECLSEWENSLKINYGFKDDSNFVIKNFRTKAGKSIFDIETNDIKYNKIHFNMLGKYNCINALAAIIISLKMNISFDLIKKSLKTFKGVKRRLSFELTKPKILIDDYAHHPKEIQSVFNCLDDVYPSLKKFVIFQPHLFTRTRDFIDEFAQILEKFDRVVLLDIYPAREKPIKGITSKILLDKIKNENKSLANENELLDIINKDNSEIIITMGAGSIGKICQSLKKKLVLEN